MMQIGSFLYRTKARIVKKRADVPWRVIQPVSAMTAKRAPDRRLGKNLKKGFLTGKSAVSLSPYYVIPYRTNMND